MCGEGSSEGGAIVNEFQSVRRRLNQLSSDLSQAGWRSWRQLCLLITLCGMLLAASPRATGQQRPPVVRVHAAGVARQDRLFLADLAGISASDAVTAERLRGISLGYAPDVGVARELSKEKIVLAITAAGFSPGSVIVEGPAIAVIRREAQTIEPSAVRTAVERAVLAGLLARGATARLTRLDLPPRLEVRTGTVDVRAALAGARSLFAPFAVSVELWVDGRIARRLSMTAQVEAFAPVLVATRDLAERIRLRTGDFEVAVRRLDRDPAKYLVDPSALRGVSLTRTLTRGEAITTDELVPEIVIKPGDSVRISGESGGLKIIVTGEARAAGHVGDRIVVKNLQSGLLFQAVIVDEGLVSVRF